MTKIIALAFINSKFSHFKLIITLKISILQGMKFIPYEKAGLTFPCPLFCFAVCEL
jgi:hypothetical protein